MGESADLVSNTGSLESLRESSGELVANSSRSSVRRPNRTKDRTYDGLTGGVHCSMPASQHLIGLRVMRNGV